MSDHTHDRPTGEPAPGQQNPHGSQNPYAAQNPYGAQNPYAPYQGSPSAQPGAGTDPYSQNPAAPNPYAQGTYTQNPYDPQNPYAQNPYPQAGYAHSGYAQGGYGQDPYAQDPYAQDPYAQATGQPGYGQPYSTAYGQSPYGTMAPYGSPAAPMRPSMGFGQAFKAYFQNYARFSGRASRSEFWWVVLAMTMISFALGLIVGVADPYGDGHSVVANVFSAIASLWNLATLVPSIAITMRRLHDANHSGWWWLLIFVPIVGWIILLVFLCQESRPEGARFDREVQPATGQ